MFWENFLLHVEPQTTKDASVFANLKPWKRPNSELFFSAPWSQNWFFFPSTWFLLLSQDIQVPSLVSTKTIFNFFWTQAVFAILYCLIKLSFSVALLGLSWWVTGASCQDCWCVIRRKVGRFFSGCLLLFSNSWNHIWEMLNSQRR